MTTKTIMALTTKNNVLTPSKVMTPILFTTMDDTPLQLKNRILQAFMKEIKYINSVRSNPEHPIRKSNLALSAKLSAYDFDELRVEYGGLTVSIPVSLADVV